MKKFTKADAIGAVYDGTGMNRNEIREVLDVFMRELKNALMKRQVIELRGFGTFEVKIRKARSGARNPRTGEAVVVRSRGVVTFRPGRELRRDAWNLAEDAPLSADAPDVADAEPDAT